MGLFNAVGDIFGSLGRGLGSFVNSIGSGVGSLFGGNSLQQSGLNDMISALDNRLAYDNALPFANDVGNLVDELVITGSRNGGNNWLQDLLPRQDFNLSNFVPFVAPLFGSSGNDQQRQLDPITQPAGQPQQAQYPAQDLLPPPVQPTTPLTPPLTLPPPPTASPGFDFPGLIKALTTAGIVGGNLFGDSNDLGPAYDKLQGIAGDRGNLGKRTLETALANQQGMINAQGTNAVERRLNRTLADIRARYASMGMPGSTMEAQDLQNARLRAQDEIFTAGQQMATTGLSTAAQLLGQESSIYTKLLDAEIANDKELERILLEYAAAVSK